MAEVADPPTPKAPPGARTMAEPATETQGATNRPVGQVEDDPMEPKNSASGTEGMG